MEGTVEWQRCLLWKGRRPNDLGQIISSLWSNTVGAKAHRDLGSAASCVTLVELLSLSVSCFPMSKIKWFDWKTSKIQARYKIPWY